MDKDKFLWDAVTMAKNTTVDLRVISYNTIPGTNRIELTIILTGGTPDDLQKFMGPNQVVFMHSVASTSDGVPATFPKTKDQYDQVLKDHVEGSAYKPKKKKRFLSKEKEEGK